MLPILAWPYDLVLMSDSSCLLSLIGIKTRIHLHILKSVSSYNVLWVIRVGYEFSFREIHFKTLNFRIIVQFSNDALKFMIIRYKTSLHLISVSAVLVYTCRINHLTENCDFFKIIHRFCWFLNSILLWHACLCFFECFKQINFLLYITQSANIKSLKRT